MNPLENEKTRPKKRPTVMTMNRSNKATLSKPRAPIIESGTPLMTVEDYLQYLVSRC